MSVGTNLSSTKTLSKMSIKSSKKLCHVKNRICFPGKYFYVFVNTIISRLTSTMQSSYKVGTPRPQIIFKVNAISKCRNQIKFKEPNVESCSRLEGIVSQRAKDWQT